MALSHINLSNQRSAYATCDAGPISKNISLEDRVENSVHSRSTGYFSQPFNVSPLESSDVAAIAIAEAPASPVQRNVEETHELATDILVDFPEGDAPPIEENSPKGVLQKMGYQFGKTLGAGCFGSVQLVKSPEGRTYALKTIPKEVAVEGGFESRWFRANSSMRGEALATRLPEHENLVRTCGYIVYDSLEEEYRTATDLSSCEPYDFIVGVLAEAVPQAEDLFDRVFDNPHYAEVDQVAQTGRQIASGVATMHHQGISHRDLKLENVLIGENQTIKIIDFGLSRRLVDGERATTQCGSPLYMSPEMVQGQGSHQKADAWSFGVMLFVMAFKGSPFPGDESDSPMPVYEQIVAFHESGKSFQDYFNDDIRPHWDLADAPCLENPQYWDLMNKLLCSEENRMTMAEASQHPFFNHKS